MGCVVDKNGVELKVGDWVEYGGLFYQVGEDEQRNVFAFPPDPDDMEFRINPVVTQKLPASSPPEQQTIPPVVISKSPTADSRTCDYENVKLHQLTESSAKHIRDVQLGLGVWQTMLMQAGAAHDYDKIGDAEWFLHDFRNGFKTTGWFESHRKINRHHLNYVDGVPSDVNLIDVLEYITDCVMAGMARSGSLYDIAFPEGLLEMAAKNTVELLKSKVVVNE